MNAKAKGPHVPAKREASERQMIMDTLSFLHDKTLTAKDLSAEVGISEKRVLQALEHVRRSAPVHGLRLVMEPARCRLCGFTFAKRDRLGKPGRCPLCKGSFIEAPRFRLTGGRGS